MLQQIVLKQSSNIATAHYDCSQQILSLQFYSSPNLVYQYSDVPFKLVREFQDAESHGKFFHQFIKNKFQFTKIDYNNNKGVA